MKFKSPIKYIKLCKTKIIIASFLLIVLLALCVYYTDNYKANAEYPSIKPISSNYQVGETVYVSGKVTGIYEGGFHLSGNKNGKKSVYRINSSSKVDINDYVSVIGILDPSYNIKASKILVVKEWKEYFLFIRSAIGGIILLFIFWRFWKFDFKSIEFIRRK